MNSLREALERADDAELDEAAGDIARHAVQAALAHDEGRAQTEAEERARQSREFEAKRQYHLTLRDATEVVRLQRERLGRRVCTTSDAEAQQIIFEALRRMQADSSDPGFSQ
jgi:hypothetical protein